jgi:hypothetical protein
MREREVGMGMADKRYTTVVLRLVLDHDGRLERGELVDENARVIGRFVGRRGLWQELRAYLDMEH